MSDNVNGRIGGIGRCISCGADLDAPLAECPHCGEVFPTEPTEQTEVPL